ncbi:hypothetical protein JB92DRAFT_3070334 [Gautieria morchelliformis]|nr:hypothetical protein JB92DRAFT_3070334 [Gautieria morchelliformis]
MAALRGSFASTSTGGASPTFMISVTGPGAVGVILISREWARPSRNTAMLFVLISNFVFDGGIVTLSIAVVS